MSEQTEPLNNSGAEAPEDYKAIFEQSRAEMEEISSFANELLPEIKQKTEAALTGINDNKKLAEAATKKFTEIQSAAETKAASLQTAQEELQAKIETVNANYDELTGIVKEVTQLQADAAVAKQSVVEDIAAIQAAKTAFNTLNTETQERAEKLTEQQNSTQELLTKIQTAHTAAETNATAMMTAQADLQGKIKALNTTHDELAGVVEAVTQLETDASAAKQSVIDDITAIQTAKTAFDTLNTETQERAKALKGEQDGVQKLLTAVQGAHSNIIAYKEELLDEKEDSNGHPIRSVKAQIHTLHTSTKDKFDEIEQERLDVLGKFDKLEGQLKSRIEALLPGAGAAGLAHAYYDAKGRYALLPFRTEFKNRWMISLHFVWHYVVGGIRQSVNHILFIAPLVSIVWLFVDMLLGKPLQGAVINGQTLSTVAGIAPSIIIFRFLLTIPLGILSWFGFHSIQLNRKLYEEYNHKQRVMQTYHSFEKEIAETGNTGLKESLLKIMLGVVAYKPALSMAEHQRAPDFMGFINALNPLKTDTTGATAGEAVVDK